MKVSFLKNIILVVFLLAAELFTQQINIYQVEQMPNKPDPYLMRDWQQVALGYDSLVFNFESVGDYLPLVWLNTNTENYPGHNSFGLHTVVGTKSPTSAEAINCLPAVIGASLVGVDKSDQDGNNYVLMCEEWFNNRPEQNVYKNHPVDDTYDDWWYETMPNVFFYQLYDLYPHTGDFDYQFVSVADRWLEAVEAMNGSATPWQVPNMTYRGFDLRTMTPYTSADPDEPESAGALAWILYNAYNETGEEKYKIGAEWCMEYLNNLSSNPSYELQLAYGAYTAARMNAEIGTDYDVRNLLGWCFFVGPLRDWGAIVGRWGNYDVSGLIGEADGNNDYAFLMNTFEQIGALVPLVRYDERFARAIGKWVLNAANAARLFYPNYLPANRQDSKEWADVHDPNSYIGHEAIRQEMYGVSPYATGDAIDGNWGETNLALYGSSHVGILGGILDATNIPMILKLDMLKTDYFHQAAYPTYLFYNPYETNQVVSFELDSGTHDVYDAITNTIIANGVSGSANISIPADGVVIAVLIPSGSQINYDLQKSFVNNIVIDYNNGIQVSNYPPRIKSLSTANNLMSVFQVANIYCTAVDKDDNELTYSWSCNDGILGGNGSQVTWTAPGTVGTFKIECIVDDGNKQDTASIAIEVLAYLNADPVINKLSATPRKININGETTITCFAEDEDGDELSYSFFYDGNLLTGNDNSVIWIAPAIEGDYVINCSVSDGRGGITEDSISVRVRDFSEHVPGSLVAFYPFNGNANDESGNNLNGNVNGADLVSDRFGNSAQAYYFNGSRDNITIPNNTLLNFQDAISISLWIKVGEFFEREAYPISHGNWENRWKMSITNNRFRWTLKTNTGTIDLDSETIIQEGELYHLVVLYSGSDYEIYTNGELDSFSSFSGAILQTDYDLTIGQVLPGNTQYNFKGELDDIRIYDYGLSYDEIQDLYDYSTSIENNYESDIPTENKLWQNYPNPFNPSTIIRYSVVGKNGHESNRVLIKVYDLLGREISTLVNEYKTQGTYNVKFNAKSTDRQLPSGVYFYTIVVGDYSSTRKFVLLK